MLTSFFMGLLKVLAVATVTYTGKQLIDQVNDSNNNADKDKQ